MSHLRLPVQLYSLFISTRDVTSTRVLDYNSNNKLLEEFDCYSSTRNFPFSVTISVFGYRLKSFSKVMKSLLQNMNIGLFIVV